MAAASDNHYGIVIDAGSSGSRIHIFEWQDPAALNNAKVTEELKQSVPQIFQDKDWTYKVTPGLSKYEEKPQKAFSKHIKPLLEYAKNIIPEDKVKETPVFVQATAGMRLLPAKKRDKILEDVCHGIKHSTDFLLSNCESQVQVIDGETEGLYGWIGLNYLLGNFNEYDTSKEEHSTFGFMDMGGASTQIAFSPSDSNEIAKHKDDMAKITLRSINGESQEWDVFVSTWLGFGANEARRRYLVQLINALPENSNKYDDDDYKTREITDPCLPKNCKTEFEYKDKDFKFVGSGDQEQCLKLIYPLLLKNLPCSDEPCLFNGVHAPQIDFFKDKFVGTSEYWYTANDVFNLGGSYNFEEFGNHVKEFCDTDWQEIKANSKQGMYNSIPTSFLADSCFKANWVLNVLHEGFGLPRAGVDKIEGEAGNGDHPLFQSAVTIQDRELSWTLGRILLYASAGVTATNPKSIVGIEPSPNEASMLDKKFIPGAILPAENPTLPTWSALKWIVPLCLIMICFLLLRNLSVIKKWRSVLDNFKHKASRFKYLNIQNDPQSQLEEGFYNNAAENFGDSDREGFKFRSKSAFSLNLNEGSAQESPGYPMRFVSASVASSPTVPKMPSKPPLHPTKALRPAFSLSDFSKFKDAKFND